MLPKHALYQTELYPDFKKAEIILYPRNRKKASGNGKKILQNTTLTLFHSAQFRAIPAIHTKLWQFGMLRLRRNEKRARGGKKPRTR